MAHPIGAQLGASGAQIAGVYGTAFGVMFAVSGLVAAPIAARFQPWRWIAGALLLWSVSTMATAFVQGLGGFWMARVALAVGEAAAMPSIIALIGALIPGRHWAFASAAIIGGSFVGGGLAFAVSGEVTRLVGPDGWRVAFFAVGACGAPLALALWLRGRREGRGPADEVSPLRLTPSVAAFPLLLFVALLPATWMAPAALALGAMIALLWLRDLRRSDPAAARETMGAPAFRAFLAAFGAILFVDSALFYWLRHASHRLYFLRCRREPRSTVPGTRIDAWRSGAAKRLTTAIHPSGTLGGLPAFEGIDSLIPPNAPRRNRRARAATSICLSVNSGFEGSAKIATGKAFRNGR